MSQSVAGCIRDVITNHQVSSITDISHISLGRGRGRNLGLAVLGTTSSPTAPAVCRNSLQIIKWDDCVICCSKSLIQNQGKKKFGFFFLISSCRERAGLDKIWDLAKSVQDLLDVDNNFQCFHDSLSQNPKKSRVLLTIM